METRCWPRSPAPRWRCPSTVPGAGRVASVWCVSAPGSSAEPTSAELRKVTPEKLAEGWRLACQARPLTARVSIEVQQTAGRRQILTASQLAHGEAQPAVSKQAVSLPEGHLRRRPERS